MRLQNKVAIVTGGGRDIGRAISRQLAAEGAKVIVNYQHDAASAEATVAEITAAGGTAVTHRADVTNPAAVDGLIEGACAAFGGGINIVVNNAGGIVARKALAEMDEAFLNRVMALNVNSTFLVAKAARAHMSAGGAIINIASQAGRDGGGPGALAYATAKGAVMAMTRGLAKELGPQGIRVNAVCPGMIATAFHDNFTKPEVRTNVAAATPLRREGDAAEIAALVAFLASDDAAFIAGANIDANGGSYFS